MSTVATNPLDVVRARLQASRQGSRFVGGKSLRQTVYRMYLDGFQRGYMCGIVPNLAASIPATTIYLTSYTQLKGLLCAAGTSNDDLLNAGSAFGAVCCTTSLLNPLFVIRLRIQLSPGHSMTQVWCCMGCGKPLALQSRWPRSIAGVCCTSRFFFWALSAFTAKKHDVQFFATPVCCKQHCTTYNFFVLMFAAEKKQITRNTLFLKSHLQRKNTLLALTTGKKIVATSHF